jgi:branched-chain amino acid aminotransferase
MAKGTHEFVDDPRNADILVSVNGKLLPRAEAVVSVFNSGFILGDGVWEGLRAHAGGIAFLDQHLERLYEGAIRLTTEAPTWSSPPAPSPQWSDCGCET